MMINRLQKLRNFLCLKILFFSALNVSFAQDQLIAEYNFEDGVQGWTHSAFALNGLSSTNPAGGWTADVNWANGGTAGSYMHNNASNEDGRWFMFSPNLILEAGAEYYLKFGATTIGPNNPSLNSRIQVRWLQTSQEPPYGSIHNFNNILLGSTYLNSAGGAANYVEFTTPIMTATISGDYRFAIGDFFNPNAWGVHYDGIRIYKVGAASETCEFSISPAAPVICEGESVTLTAGGDAINYSWSASPDLSTTSGASVISTPQATATYTITGTSGACTSIQNVVVTVNPNPVITTTPSSPSICAGESVTISANGADTYSWSPSGGLSSTTNAVVAANPTTSVTYVLTGSSNNCSSQTEIFVEVNQAEPLVINPQNAVLCEGDTLLFQIIGAEQISWGSSNEIQFISTGNYMAIPSASTDFILSGDGFCVTPSTLSITVENLPVATFSFEQTVDYTVQFTNNSIDGNTFLWSFENNSSTQNNPSFTFPFDGNYNVRLIVQNDCGVDTIIQSVTVLKLSSDNVESNEILIFPNPASESLFIQSPIVQFDKITVFNYAGQIVLEHEGNINGNNSVSISDLPAGLYFIQLLNKEKVFKKKFIKR